MKFDTIIIGGGLSGLICGIRLSQEGQRCVIVSSGQSALHFSSGSFDLLNALPDGSAVSDPLLAVEDLIRTNPTHPYSKLGKESFKKLSLYAESFLSGIGLSLQGSARNNHYRITPMGTLKSTWLTVSDFGISESDSELPWKKVSIFNPAGFLDFYPQFIADEFLKLGTESNIEIFDLPDLDYLRRNPSELRATNIARILDKESNLDLFSKILNDRSGNSDAIIIPACIGLKSDSISHLKRMVSKPIFLLPTLPPSAMGIRIQQYLHDYFLRLGGTYMLGDSIKKADTVDNSITRVYSYNHGDIPFVAKNVVLATGSYFSQGLIATSDQVYEPIFNLDVSYLSDRQQWYDSNMFKAQGYQQFGVKTDNAFNGLKGGEPIRNLFVSGAILEGFNPVKEGTGAGVSILTALHIANNILKQS